MSQRQKIKVIDLKKHFLFFSFFWLLLSCNNLDRKLDKLPIQATKSKVLVRLGDPYKITRKNGKDHWSYRVIIQGRHYTRDVIFKDGKLYRVSGYVPFPLTKF